jgi:hypothetical protein
VFKTAKEGNKEFSLQFTKWFLSILAALKFSFLRNNDTTYSWFKNFCRVFACRVLSFWVNPLRLNFMYRRFETLFLKMELTECSETSAHKISDVGDSLEGKKAE